jgi:hypothetical protein
MQQDGGTTGQRLRSVHTLSITSVQCSPTWSVAAGAEAEHLGTEYDRLRKPGVYWRRGDISQSTNELSIISL